MWSPEPTLAALKAVSTMKAWHLGVLIVIVILVAIFWPWLEGFHAHPRVR